MATGGLEIAPALRYSQRFLGGFMLEGMQQVAGTGAVRESDIGDHESEYGKWESRIGSPGGTGRGLFAAEAAAVSHRRPISSNSRPQSPNLHLPFPIYHSPFPQVEPPRFRPEFVGVTLVRHSTHFDSQFRTQSSELEMQLKLKDRNGLWLCRQEKCWISRGSEENWGWGLQAQKGGIPYSYGHSHSSEAEAGIPFALFIAKAATWEWKW